MPSHAQLRSPVVALQWHEAVAMVQEVTAQLVSAGGYVAPTADQLSIGRGGVMTIAPGRMAADSRKDPSRLVVGLGRLLTDLLDTGDAPEQLSRLAETAAADPPGFASIDDFCRALAFFERPDRRAILATLAERILASEERTRIESELDGLTRKARTAELPPPEKGGGEKTTRRRRLGVAVAALSVLAAVLVGVAIYGSTSTVSLASGAGVVVKAGGRLIDAIRTNAQTALGAETAPADAATSGGVTVRHVQTRGPVSRSDRAPAPRKLLSGLEMAPIAISRVTLPDLQPSLVAWSAPTGGDTKSGSEVVPAGQVDHDGVYEPDDDEVEPPELVRPHLPTVPTTGVDAERLSVVEILVSEDGDVDQVRVVANPVSRRYYTAMLMAAVKTWKFRPATKGGTPVRYRVRMALTQ